MTRNLRLGGVPTESGGKGISLGKASDLYSEETSESLVITRINDIIGGKASANQHVTLAAIAGLAPSKLIAEVADEEVKPNPLTGVTVTGEGKRGKSALAMDLAQSLAKAK